MSGMLQHQPEQLAADVARRADDGDLHLDSRAAVTVAEQAGGVAQRVVRRNAERRADVVTAHLVVGGRPGEDGDGEPVGCSA